MLNNNQQPLLPLSISGSEDSDSNYQDVPPKPTFMSYCKCIFVFCAFGILFPTLLASLISNKSSMDIFPEEESFLMYEQPLDGPSTITLFPNHTITILYSPDDLIIYDLQNVEIFVI